ncbi:MAG TPA: adenylate/guanylate cyclase domain-containing protein, partial [Candidatus Ozemobacteraceae bacterium]|nr:adenylate/guanylate cyclase domain-containing protein [Candidatus Ozemobacteraceae bacterium]
QISSVWGIAFLLVYSIDRFAAFLYQQNENNPSLFHLRHPLGNIDTAVYHFTYTGGVRDFWPGTAMLERDLINVVKRYLLTQRSGYLWTERQGETLLQVWEKVSDQLVLVAGQVRIPARPPLLRDAVLLLLLLAVVSISLNLLMADLLSSLFVAPLRVLSEAVEDVKHGDFGVRIDIRSTDELEEVGDAFNRMIEALQQRERLKRFVPAPVVQRLEDATVPTTSSTARADDEVEVVVLASDIRGFTRLSETVPPDILVRALNQYFTLMQDAVTQQNGRVLKLIGDAILAVFLPDASGTAPVAAALQAARDMRAQLRRFNQQRAAEGLFSLENGIGLALGQALPIELGQSGSRREFTLFGAPLTEAQALESLSAHGRHSRIVAGTAFVDRLGVRGQCTTITGDGESQPDGWELPEVDA